MSVAFARGGWLVAAVVSAMWLLARRRLDARMEAVARACHELRGPIGAARLGVELGSRRGALSAAQLQAIDTELGRATLALEDLGGARDGRPPALETTMLDLGGLLADSVEAWRTAAGAAGVELRLRWTGAAELVRGDRLRLAQATGNLIANAIEHGAATVEVRGCAREGAARIEVVDDGPGLPAPVTELTRRARRGRGRHGRGLAIAAQVAAAHGGRLAAAPV
ncbi:MAG: sensor histidine kinase, partial [Solirubrobacteraceae bacterium]